jgi:CubicO group peptidase (beta-lactamase class C family)
VPLLLAGAAACTQLATPERVYLDRVVAPDPLSRQLDVTMRQFVREGFTGTVLVARGNRVLLYKGYGDANRARHLPNTAETKYPFGALANQFTATALLQLEAEGRLSLSDPAARWIGADAGDATIAELLTRSREVRETASSAMAARYGGSLAPGVERFRSAGPSYAMLERVLSQVSGRPAPDVLKNRLFVPAKLDRTVWDDGFLNDSLVSRGYTGPYGATVVVTGLVGPLADLFHWHQALLAGAPLGPEARERMFTAAENGYGLGWVMGRTAGGDPVIEHASDQPGFQLWYGYFPGRDVLVLLAVNNDLGFRRPVTERLTDLLLEGVPSPAGNVTKADRVGGE